MDTRFPGSRGTVDACLWLSPRLSRITVDADEYVWTNAHSQVSPPAGRDSLQPSKGSGSKTDFASSTVGTADCPPQHTMGRGAVTEDPVKHHFPSSPRGRPGWGTVLDSDPAFSLGKLFGTSSPVSAPLAWDLRGLFSQSYDRVTSVNIPEVTQQTVGCPGTVILDTVGASGPPAT